MNLKILVVDDDTSNLVYIEETLTTNFHNLEITSASSGEEAIFLTKNSKFDIIIMDIRMPGRNGYDTTSEIKKNVANKDTIIIYITAHDPESKNYNKALERGGIDYLTKPISSNELIRLIGLYSRFLKREKKINSRLKEINYALEVEIYQRKKAEKDLIHANRKFENIVGKSSSAILIIDKNEKVKYINSSAEKIFSCKAEEIIDTKFLDKSQYDNKSTITLMKKNEEIGIGEITISKTMWENEDANLVLINDITKHKQLAEKFRKAKEKAQKSNQLKSDYLSNMSHEIRSPMNGIIGLIELLEKNELTNKESESYIASIKSCTNHLLNLLNDIIDLSKIESGKLKINPVIFNLHDTFIDIYEIYSSNEKVRNKNLNLTIDIPMGSENSFVKTDPGRLKQIFFNLIGNSIKFTEKGNIKFGYKIKNKNLLKFFVEDSGIGIPKDMQSTIFERFSQIDNRIESNNEGKGLGLAITKSLVELLGGKIKLESEPNNGSTFYFDLPLQLMSVIDNKTASKTTKNKQGKKLNDRAILFVDDLDINYTLVKKMLSERNPKILWSKDGKEAIKTYKKNNIDLILMDIRMPQMDGFEATKKIRKIDKKIPIIAQTAHAIENEKDKCIEAGCNDFISKPFKKEELLVTIDKYLD